MVWRPSIAPTSGPHISTLPPRPMTSSSGSPLPSTRTRSRKPSTTTNRVAGEAERRARDRPLGLVDIGSRRGAQRGMAVAARPCGGRHAAPRLLGDPARPVLPPAALDLGGAAQPFLRIGGVRPLYPVAGLGIAGRVDQALDVSAGAEDELGGA